MTRLIACLVTGLVAAGCGGALISNKQELQIGAGVDEQIEQEYRIVAPNDPVAQWAKQFIQPFANASKKFRNPSEFKGYKIEVIADDKLVNAFAAPGGYVYISTGLIKQASDCAEIAGVMGHELAHVTERHSARQLEKAFAVQLASDFFLDDGLTKTAAETIFQFLQATTFSRDHEREADDVGLVISHDAGYDPDGLARFFQKLLKLQKGSQPPEFLSSHPATDERIRDVRAAIKKRYGNKAGGATACKTSMKLPELQQRINGGQLKTQTRKASRELLQRIYARHEAPAPR
ncbi:MAG: M48 family metalloprotease [Myxococcales bacterium]|nr:M48 family metalloprotease [Myxococcales bacterium]